MAEDTEFGKSEGLPAPQYKGFTKQSLYLTMRDGVKIAIEVVLPKNLPSTEKIPAIIYQTRYWRLYDMRFPFERFEPSTEFLRVFTSYGYAVVIVDVRGTGASFGTWPYPWSKDEIFDGGQVADWIIAQPWSAENRKPHETLEETYRRILTSPSGALHLYVNYILKEDLGSSTKETRLLRILQALSQEKNTASQIARHIKLKLSSLPYYLQELERYDLIEKRNAKYYVTDKIIRDYFTGNEV